MYVSVKQLPDPVRDALSALGYGKADIEVRHASTVTLSSGGSAGRRAFATIVNLTSGSHVTTWGSWGGPNMFVRNAVDSDDTPMSLPPNGVALTGSKGGGGPVFATLHVPASMAERILPAPAEQLTTPELDALYCYARVRGGQYRTDELRRRRVSPDTIDSLVSRGYLKRNRAGATAITTEGKNAAGDHR